MRFPDFLVKKGAKPPHFVLGSDCSLPLPPPLPPPDLAVVDRGEVRENMHMIILGDQRVQSFLVHQAFMT